MTYFGSAAPPADFFCETAGVSFLTLSVDDVTTMGTTVTGFGLGVVDVTGVVHIGIFFGSSVNMRRHLNAEENKFINFSMRPEFLSAAFAHL